VGVLQYSSFCTAERQPKLVAPEDTTTIGAQSLHCVAAVQGEQRALARFQSAEAAKAFLDSKPDGKLTVGDAEASLALLEGEEEAAYIAKVGDPPFLAR